MVMCGSLQLFVEMFHSFVVGVISPSLQREYVIYAQYATFHPNPGYFARNANLLLDTAGVAKNAKTSTKQYS